MQKDNCKVFGFCSNCLCSRQLCAKKQKQNKHDIIKINGKNDTGIEDPSFILNSQSCSKRDPEANYITAL